MSPDDVLPRLSFRRSPGRFDHFPELWILLQRLVFVRFQTGAEEKILQRVPAQNPMHDHAQFVPLEVNAVVAHAEPVQRPPRAFQFAELVQFGVHHLLRQAAKLAEDLQLQFLGHLRQFRGAGWIKNDLEWTHLI
jgi:hypothetical protein